MFKPLLRVGAAANRFLRCTSGISSVEFVIVLNLFILFLFGTIGFSAISYAHNNMVNAAREATRRMAVAGDAVVGNGVTYSCSTADMTTLAVDVPPPQTGAQEIACDYLANWALTWQITATEVVVDACDSTVQVNISTNAEDAFIVDFMGFFGAGDLLVAEVKMRKELEKRCTL